MTELLDDIGVCPATLLSEPMAASPDDLLGAFDAAAAAGDPSLSVWAFHATGPGLDHTADALAERGLRIGAVEAAMAWAGGPGEAMETEARGLLEVADRFGAGVVAAVTMDPELPDRGAAVAGLHRLGEMAADAGVRVAFEFLPWSAVPSLADLDRLLTDADHDSLGILLDMWHWHHQPGGADLELLRAQPGERITYVQLCDSPADVEGAAYDEAMAKRLPPGEGVVDVVGVLAVLDEIGARPYVASEVFSAEIAALGPEAAARRIHDACAALPAAVAARTGGTSTDG